MIFVDTNVFMYVAQARLGDNRALEPADVSLARELLDRHAGLGARALVHLACCLRRGVTREKTFDRAFAAAFD